MDNQESSQSVKALTSEELGITLELANLISGAASSTLAMLLDQEMELGKPELVEVTSIQDLNSIGIHPQSVMAVLRYLSGIKAPVCYVLSLQTAITIAEIMMGGTEPAGEVTEISDIQLSAVGEAISQMMGAAANSISHFLSQQVDISAPDVEVFSIENLTRMIPEMAEGGLVVVSYKLSGSKTIKNCELFQITPSSALQEQVSYIRSLDPATSFASSESSAHAEANPVFAGVGAPAAREMQEAAHGGYASSGDAGIRQPVHPVTVQPVEFPSFDSHIPAVGSLNKNLELVMDVCLNLTVELGRTELSIKDVLELTRGSVIELNRVAGEPVDLFANGKMIAKGEVVVIEDNFGLRITSIVSPADRIRGL